MFVLLVDKREQRAFVSDGGLVVGRTLEDVGDLLLGSKCGCGRRDGGRGGIRRRGENQWWLRWDWA